MHLKICGEFKRNPDEAIKDLELRMARTRERTAENGNATTGDHSRGHRHRHRNFESECCKDKINMQKDYSSVILCVITDRMAYRNA
ncbi:hypothetical protein ACH3XW_16505 [Acanthocheilonema viteae]